MASILERVRWFAGVLWTLSWFELYLEIFRFRHVALPSSVGLTIAAPVMGPDGHAGWWLRADLACAVIAPVIFIASTMLGRQARRTGTTKLGASVSLPTVTLAGIGALVATLGLINQLIWRPAFVIDLTLRQGNGGFVAIGLACILVAGALAHHHAKANEVGSSE